MSQQQPSYPQLSYGQPMNYTTQPMYSPAEKMSTTPVDPLNAPGKPRGSDGQREFATGLCGACSSETGTCLASCLLCCACLELQKVERAREADLASETGAPCIHANSKHRYNALSSTNIPATSNGECHLLPERLLPESIAEALSQLAKMASRALWSHLQD